MAGRRTCSHGKLCEAGFAIVGYGKLGGYELGYGSDLDIVFLHDSTGSEQHTAGPRVIDNTEFFTRLSQRIIHILNTFTAAGVLYEVDMRLRPNGNSGLLVSSMEAFDDYQQGSAWTWENQALIRARVVVGSSGNHPPVRAHTQRGAGAVTGCAGLADRGGRHAPAHAPGTGQDHGRPV